MNIGKKLALLATLFATVTVVACGGGAGNSAPSPSPSISSVLPPSPPIENIITTVPAPTYAAGSNELLAFNTLNAERSRCGFGKLAQNTKLDQAAANHRAYMVANQSIAHDEAPGKTGFTGATPQARADAVGYDGTVAEFAPSGIYTAPETFGTGDRQIYGLIGLPYHSLIATDGVLDVGMSYSGGAFVAVTGLPTNKSRQTAPGVRTYPCNGSTNVRHVGVSELPSPFPNEPGATWGPSIIVVGDGVRITSATVTGPQGSIAIKTIYGDGQAVDPNGFCKAGRICIIPMPLQQGTTYQVVLTGTLAGQPFPGPTPGTLTFSFTTIGL